MRLLLLLGVVAMDLAPFPAQAQSGWPSWPWSQPEQRREPRPLPPLQQSLPPPGAGQGSGQPGGPGPGFGAGQRPPTADGMTARERFCYQLEQKLVQTSTQGTQAREQLPKIEQEMKLLERTYQQSKVQLDRSECWETFLFSKSLRRTRQCYDLNKQAEESRQRLADLEGQRQTIMGSRGSKSTQDELVDALARNGCGANYQQEASRRERQGGSSFPFGGGDDEEGEGGGMRRQGALPFSTFRTVCVRLCDGYYFPVSFSTMQSQFPKDSQVCSSKCAAPTELFYYQNPGAEMEQAQSVTGQPYSKLPNAFRHRKEVVQGCSCKVADYQPELLGIKGQRRADPAGAQPAGTPGLAATAATPAAAPVATGAVPKRPQARAAAPAVPAAADQDLIAQTIERTRQAQPAQQVPGVTPPPAAPVPRLRPPERPVPAQQ